MEFRVDVRGIKIPQESIDCDVDGNRWRFVLADYLKAGQTFHVALFANMAAMSDAVLAYPREHRACALLESPINDCYRDIEELIRRFPIIMTHQQHLLDCGEPFVPLMFGTNWIGVRTEADTQSILNEHPQKTKLVSFIGSLDHPNKGAYRFRRDVADSLIAREDIDRFGKGIHEVPGKREAIAPYRFSVAMENASSDLYFSEKLIDCLLLETIPVYYGCPGIGNPLDPRGLLTFSTLEELQIVIDQLSDDLFDEMRPFALENKRRIIEHNWHSHASLFNRMADELSQRLTVNRPVRPKSMRGIQHRVRKLWSQTFASS